MAFLIGGANSAAADAAYSVANSCRFNYADSPYLSKTNSGSSATDIDKYTLSVWVKRSQLGAYGDGNGGNIIASTTAAYFQLYFKDDDTLRWQEHGDDELGNLITNRVFRDPSAWYHIVCIYDSSDGTSGDRMQMWINGVRETSFSTEAQPDQNTDGNFGVASQARRIGNNAGGNRDFDGYMAEVACLDGTAASATDFGEFDEDSPTIWKPKDVSGLSFGTHGFYLDFEDSANLGNDANGGTDFGETNIAAADQCQDSPTNNFATLNSINMPASNQPTLSEGNTKTITSSSGDGHFGGVSTIGVSKGKWYVEAKAVFSTSTADSRNGIGFTGTEETVLDNNRWAGGGTDGVNDHEYTYESNNGEWTYDLGSGSSSTQTSGFSDSYDNGDIIGLYLDLDNNKYYAAINGSIQNSGTGLAITAAASTPLGFYFFGCSDSTGTSTTATWDWNFGNGSYAGTAVSSAVADANGYGQFEYDPSDGGSSSFDSAAKDFYALCTKNLAEFG